MYIGYEVLSQTHTGMADFQLLLLSRYLLINLKYVSPHT